MCVGDRLKGSTKESARDAEKVADFMLARLNKSNLIVKLKALQLIAVHHTLAFLSLYDDHQWLTLYCPVQYCVREGSPAFSGAIREEEQDIAAYLRMFVLFLCVSGAVQGSGNGILCLTAKRLSGVCLGALWVLVEYTGPPDPVYGDERYRRIRVAAQVRASLFTHCTPTNLVPPTPLSDQRLRVVCGLRKRSCV